MPVENVAPYLRELRPLFRKYGYNPSLYGHMGQGCIHCRVGFDLYTQPGIETYKKFMHEAVDLVVKFGGVASGEHGDGQARGNSCPRCSATNCSARSSSSNASGIPPTE